MTRVDAFSPAAVHGMGLFETVLVVRGRPVLLDAHLERLFASCEAFGFTPPDRARLAKQLVRAASSAAESREAALRVAWLATSDDLRDEMSWSAVASIGTIPRGTLARRRRGRVVVLDAGYVRSLPQHKTTSYLPCILALREAQARGADEALFVDGKGRILEGSTTNVFAVDGTRLITAPVSAGLLPGITRAWVIDAARDMGVRVVERALTRDALLAGSFMTGSLTTIAPIREVDGVRCAEAKIVTDLQRRFRAASRMESRSTRPSS